MKKSSAKSSKAVRGKPVRPSNPATKMRRKLGGKLKARVGAKRRR